MGPLGRQKPIRRDTEGGVVMAERDDHVAAVLLPEVAAILAANPHGVDSLLEDLRVVDRAGHHAAMTIHLVEYISIGDPHQRSIVPWGERATKWWSD